MRRLAGGTVSVQSSPVIVNPGFNDGSFQLSIATENGVSYAAQYKHNLAGDGTVQQATDPSPAPDQRFYRVIVQ